MPFARMIEITNRRNYPVTIQTFTIDVQVRQRSWIFPSKWTRGAQFSDNIPLVQVGDPPSQSMRIALLGGWLMSQMEAKSIAPHDTIKGWVLMDFPKDYNEATQPFTYRIRIEDTEGDGMTLIDNFVNPNMNVAPETGMATGDPVDLSGYHIEHWAAN